MMKKPNRTGLGVLTNIALGYIVLGLFSFNVMALDSNYKAKIVIETGYVSPGGNVVFYLMDYNDKVIKLLSTGFKVDEFCRSSKQCDFVENLAANIASNYGAEAGEIYVKGLQNAWLACDKKYGRCSASQGIPYDQFNVGYMYFEGLGVPQNDIKAFEWFVKSAERGYSFAQFNVAQMYYYGRGVSRDASKSVYWLSKAAEQGHAKAQYNLGASYMDGDGVIKDTELAFYWLRRSAENGNEVAKNTLFKYKK